MNRFWGHTLSVASLAVLAGSYVPACAHNDGSLFVDGVLAPPIPSGDMCTYTASPTSQMLSGGAVDAALVLGSTGEGGYAEIFLLGNQLIPQGNATTPDTETSR